MLTGQAKILLFLLLFHCFVSCTTITYDDDYYYIPEEVILIRPRRTLTAAVKRTPLSREKRVQMITDLINYMNDSERLRFG